MFLNPPLIALAIQIPIKHVLFSSLFVTPFVSDVKICMIFNLFAEFSVLPRGGVLVMHDLGLL